MQRIGIMGGTFDPIHFGHLVAAEWVRFEFALDKVIFVPAGNPPHKAGREITGAEHRYRMVEMAIKDNPYFDVSPVEKERGGKSYTIDTIAYFKSVYNGAEIFFIMGADSLLTFNTWKNIDQLIDMCRFVVVTRPGYVIEPDFWEKSGLPPIAKEKIKFIEIPGMDISSSEIRKRIKQNKPIKYLLPRELEEYIYEHRLYQEAK
nr:nicotinate-nucleotide adenylyltransferase [Thermosyntropha sp.]